MTRAGVGGLCCVAFLLLASLAPQALPRAPAGAATVVRADASGGDRVLSPLPRGLSTSEHAALRRAGAYGPHPVRVLLLGDSIALTLGVGLGAGSQGEYGVTISDHATIGCDLDPHLQVLTSGRPGPATPGCTRWRALWPLLVAQDRPEVVVLGLGRWEVTDHLLHGSWVHIGEPAWDEHLSADLQSAIAIFRTFGAKVVLFTMPYVDPSDRQPDGQAWSENTPARAKAYNALVRLVAHSDPREVSVIGLNRMLSPDGVYTASLDGVQVRSPDGIHISAAGGYMLQSQILPEIDRIGMEDETAARAHA